MMPNVYSLLEFIEPRSPNRGQGGLSLNNAAAGIPLETARVEIELPVYRNKRRGYTAGRVSHFSSIASGNAPGHEGEFPGESRPPEMARREKFLLRRNRAFLRLLLCLGLSAQPGLPALQDRPQDQAPPSGEKPQEKEPGNKPEEKQPLRFTKIDFELLDRVRQFEKKLGDDGLVYTDPDVTKYVAFVGGAMVPDAPPPENVEWRFKVLRDPEANAFALPNGSVYVNTGLLARLDNEAQLAGVLGHEVTHVLQRHTFLENRSARKKMVAIDVFTAIAAGGGQAGGIAGAVVSLVSQMIPVILVGTIYGYTRELEKEADVRAVGAMVDADYSAEELPNALKALKNQYEVDLTEGKQPVFYSSHPRLNERIAYITELVNDTRPKTRHPMVEAERYAAKTEKAVRHDVALEIQVGRARTAVAIAHRLIKADPNSAENYFLLGEAYRALGPRAEKPPAEEQTSGAIKKTRNLLGKSTLAEYEKTLLAAPGGPEALAESTKLAEDAYKQAGTIDPAFAKTYRGLGFLYDRAGQAPQAIEAYRKYLEAAPAAFDRPQILQRLEALQKASAGPPPAQTPP
jgi:beta-barrel assembly-enhancing protease